MPEVQIDTLTKLWGASLLRGSMKPLFADHDDLLWYMIERKEKYLCCELITLCRCIDHIPHGEVWWECFHLSYQGEETAPRPLWMDQEYEFWFRDPHEEAKRIMKTIPIKTRPYKEFVIRSTSIHRT
jgi:hypothetical protein